jgi:uncharacterized protein (DUF1810 family)
MERFLNAQESVYSKVLAELVAGHKRTHWMWFIFPQIAGLGFSAMAQRYAITSLDEAREYLAHPVLGKRLEECTKAVLRHGNRTAYDIFDTPDDMKFRSSMTLFHRAAPSNPLFVQALDTFYGGEEDPNTITRI